MSHGFNLVKFKKSVSKNITKPKKKPIINKRKIKKYVLNLVVLNFEIIRKKNM